METVNRLHIDLRTYHLHNNPFGKNGSAPNGSHRRSTETSFSYLFVWPRRD